MSDIVAERVETVGRGVVVTPQEQRKVVFASSLGGDFPMVRSRTAGDSWSSR